MTYKPDAPETYQGKQVIINSDRLLPTEPAVLGDYLGDIWLLDLLECLEGLIDDLVTKVAFITTAPGAPTGPNPSNKTMLSLRKQQIEDLKNNIQNFKSKITKIA